jgi:hypothetical protein
VKSLKAVFANMKTIAAQAGFSAKTGQNTLKLLPHNELAFI